MKKIFLVLTFIMAKNTIMYSQNPYKYENDVLVITLNQRESDNETAKQILAVAKDKNDNEGRNLISINTYTDNVGKTHAILAFEKSSSYREAELYKLINELTTRIDATSKKYTDSAMEVIQTNVLNYLKSIPNDVITQAYKDELTKIILSEAEDKIKMVVEELKKEIRDQTNH